MKFYNPAAFQLLWFIPLILFVSWWWGKRAIAKLSAVYAAKVLPPLIQSVSPTKRKIKLGLEILVLVLLVLALARPQSGQSMQKVKKEGVEIMLLVDVSQSMLAEDVRPSRLQLVQKELLRLVDQVGGDRLGLIAFAGSAVVLSPLTGDKSALKMFIESLSPAVISAQGTDFRRALVEAQMAFSRGGIESSETSFVGRLVLIVSDGEDNETGAVDLVKEMNRDGVRIYTLAVGTEQGGTIPMRDDQGRAIGNLKDQKGQDVITQTRGETLRELAQAGQGGFYHLTFGGTAVQSLLADINRLQKTQFEANEVVSYEEDFQIYLLVAFVLAVLEMLLSERRHQGRLWRGRFEVAES